MHFRVFLSTIVPVPTSAVSFLTLFDSFAFCRVKTNAATMIERPLIRQNKGATASGGPLPTACRGRQVLIKRIRCSPAIP